MSLDTVAFELICLVEQDFCQHWRNSLSHDQNKDGKLKHMVLLFSFSCLIILKRGQETAKTLWARFKIIGVNTAADSY